MAPLIRVCGCRRFRFIDRLVIRCSLEQTGAALDAETTVLLGGRNDDEKRAQIVYIIRDDQELHDDEGIQPDGSNKARFDGGGQ